MIRLTIILIKGRVLLLSMYEGWLLDEVLRDEIYPIALILLSNKIENAPETFKYFQERSQD